MWGEITYQFPNFNGATVEVWKWIRKFIPHFIEHVITYPRWAAFVPGLAAIKVRYSLHYGAISLGLPDGWPVNPGDKNTCSGKLSSLLSAPHPAWDNHQFPQLVLIYFIIWPGLAIYLAMCPVNHVMMTSSNGNISRVTGLLCGEFTGHRWIPLTNPSDAELWCFLWSVPEQTAEQTIETLVIWDEIGLIMTSPRGLPACCIRNPLVVGTLQTWPCVRPSADAVQTSHKLRQNLFSLVSNNFEYIIVDILLYSKWPINFTRFLNWVD